MVINESNELSHYNDNDASRFGSWSGANVVRDAKCDFTYVNILVYVCIIYICIYLY